MDGGVLHSGAVNRYENLRHIIFNSVIQLFIGQQKSFYLTIRPYILAAATEKFLGRCRLPAT